MGDDPIGVNKVRADGRITLPPELAEEYEDEHMAFYKTDSQTVELQVVKRE